MLSDCELDKNTMYNMQSDRMPAADKLIVIANYLEVSAEYLMGLTDDPTPPKKVLTEEEKLLAEICKLTPEQLKNATQYVEFLKIKQDFAQEVSDALSINKMKPLQE